MTAFHEKRRQQFLTETYTKEYERWLKESVSLWLQNLPEGDSEEEKISGAAWLVADDTYEIFSLRYTAGEPLDVLREELTGVVEAYERYQQALSLYEEEPDTAVFYFREMVHYSRLMQLIGLAYLFHRRDLLARIAALADTNFYGQDALYEELLDYALPDRMDTDQLFHARPYEHLVHAMYRDTDEESIEDLQKYVQAWYPAMKHVPWHDGHLRMTDTDGDYFGYWAFEAGAVAFLCELDDSAITHMVYPKDLVAYARK